MGWLAVDSMAIVPVAQTTRAFQPSPVLRVERSETSFLRFVSFLKAFHLELKLEPEAIHVRCRVTLLFCIFVMFYLFVIYLL